MVTRILGLCKKLVVRQVINWREAVSSLPVRRGKFLGNRGVSDGGSLSLDDSQRTTWLWHFLPFLTLRCTDVEMVTVLMVQAERRLRLFATVMIIGEGLKRNVDPRFLVLRASTAPLVTPERELLALVRMISMTTLIILPGELLC